MAYFLTIRFLILNADDLHWKIVSVYINKMGQVGSNSSLKLLYTFYNSSTPFFLHRSIVKRNGTSSHIQEHENLLFLFLFRFMYPHSELHFTLAGDVEDEE